MKKKTVMWMLKTLARLPLSVLYLFSDFIYFVVYYIIGYRKKVVRRNLAEAFPEKNRKVLRKIERAYYHYMCDIIVEVVKLLHISKEEMGRRVTVENAGEVKNSVEEGRPVVLFLGHYGNWEWVQELGRHLDVNAYKASIYHPLHSPLWNDIYSEIRSRWQINIIPQLKAIKTLLNPANRPWICGFIADHRPEHASDDSRTVFLNHDMAFIYGPETIGTRLGADYFFLEMARIKRGEYRIILHKLEPEESGKPYPYTRAFWKKFEQVIRENPAYWLWSHKRWKRDRLIKNPTD